MSADLIQLASGFGAPGLLIAYMVWDRRGQMALAEKRIAADIEVARAMATLATKFDAIHH